jgi:hypothetical protein
MNLRTSVPRYEFVNDVKPKADESDMFTHVHGNMSHGNMSLRTSVSRYEFVNDVEPNRPSEPGMIGVSGKEVFFLKKNDVVTDVEKSRSRSMMWMTALIFS